MWCIASGFCGEELNSLIELRRALDQVAALPPAWPCDNPKQSVKTVLKMCVFRGFAMQTGRREAIDERTKKKDKTWLAVNGREGLAYDGESIENKSTLSTKT